MRIMIVLLMFSVSLVGFCQERLVIGKSNDVTYDNKKKNIYIDSIVTLKNHGNVIFEKEFLVFFDDNMSRLAFESSIRNDTAKTIDYWRNGRIKQVSKFIIVNRYPTLYYNEIYCDNGQLIRGYYPNKKGKSVVEQYYCNGNIMSRISKNGILPDGMTETWHENGVKGSEIYFNNNVKIGKWKFWDEEGVLIRTETYQYGHLIETINYKLNIRE